MQKRMLYILLLCACLMRPSLPVFGQQKTATFHVKDSLEIQTLHGPWAFFWQRHLGFPDLAKQKPDTLFYLPADWGDYGYSVFGYGTYYLQVVLPACQDEWMLEVPNISSAYLLLVNGDTLAKGGMPATSREKEVPDYRRRWVSLPKSLGDTLHIVIQASNFHYNRSGVYLPIMIGTRAAMKQKFNRGRQWEIFVMGALFFMFFYHLVLYFFMPTYHKRAVVYLALACLLFLIRIPIVNSGTQVVFDLLPAASFHVLLRLEVLSVLLGTPLTVLFVHSLFPMQGRRKVERLVLLLSGLMMLITLLMPAYIYGYLLPVLYLMLVFVYPYVIVLTYKAWRKKRSGASWLMLGYISVALLVGLEVLFFLGVVPLPYGNTASMGMFLFLLTQSIALAQIFSDAFHRAERLSATLETRVQERTIELQMQKEYMTQLNQSMMDSLNYAKRIQTAVLPPEKELKRVFRDGFVLYLPKAIVSGDFYWVYEENSTVWVAVGDCTGHGVPGAFMALLAKNALDSVVIQQKTQSPKEVLERLDAYLRAQLGQDDTERKQGQSYDGMVLALCKIDKSQDVLTFAGAERPLWLIRNRQLQQWETSRDLIAGYAQQNKSFDEVTIALHPGDKLYMFSDGFMDQFNGMSRKKFSKRRFESLLVDISSYQMQEQKDILFATFERWRGKTPQIDDVIVVGIEY